jgi:hypothetical protein
MMTAPLSNVTDTGEAPKRKRGRPRKVVAVVEPLAVLAEADEATRAEIVERIVADLRGGLDFGHVFAEYEDMPQKPLIDAAVAEWQRERAERKERERQAAEAEQKRCETCDAILAADRTKYGYSRCDPCETLERDRANAEYLAAEKRQKRDAFLAEQRALTVAPGRLVESHGDARLAVLAMVLEDGVGEGVAERAVAHVIEESGKAAAAKIDNKARRSRATLALSQRVRDWRDARDDLDVYDVAIIEAQLQNVNGTNGLAYCSAETIAHRGHVNETTVRRHLRKLADLGLFRMEAGRGNRRPTRCTFLV